MCAPPNASTKPPPAPAIPANHPTTPGCGTRWAWQSTTIRPLASWESRSPEPIGCANCHEANTMKLIVTNPALEEALKAQGKDWRTFTRQEMRTVVCANCHVEYYFKGDGKYLTFPWEKRHKDRRDYRLLRRRAIQGLGVPGAGTPMLKAQHPEYELFTADSTHYKAGVACADCHMPYTRDGAAKFSTHDVHSPLLDSGCRLRAVPHRRTLMSSSVSRPSRPRSTSGCSPLRMPSSPPSTPSRPPAALAGCG